MSIYEVSDSELQLLERGSPESLFLNFAIFLISTAVSFLVTILSTDIPSTRAFIVFVVITVLGFVGGALLLALWAWHRRSRATIFREIRARMPPEGIIPEPGVARDVTTEPFG